MTFDISLPLILWSLMLDPLIFGSLKSSRHISPISFGSYGIFKGLSMDHPQFFPGHVVRVILKDLSNHFSSILLIHNFVSRPFQQLFIEFLLHGQGWALRTKNLSHLQIILFFCQLCILCQIFWIYFLLVLFVIKLFNFSHTFVK